MRKRVLATLMLMNVMIFFSACSYSDEEVSQVSNEELISELQKENEGLKAKIELLQLQNKEEQEQLEKQKFENKDMKEKMDLESSKYKLQISTLETEILALKEKVEEENIVRKYFNEFPKSIDGTSMVLDDDSYYIEYDNDIFISTKLMRELYDDDYYGIVVRSFPCENYLIKSDGYISIHSLIAETGIETKFVEQFKEGKYDSVVGGVEGIEFEVGEVGLIRYTLTKPIYTTERGITIGSTRAEVTKAYGRLGEKDSKEWFTFRTNVEYSEGCKFKFTFDENDEVKEISYGWI